mmetsp:Transcript_28734/g.66288  ORF Transcript_28734/g.66288 Transcript_28734/m.66288 type:complete len:307 (-) Transcript_28734:53-973(-)|eukprot:CAMPEP_0114541034 /NCGR_PEP_ID=MMETSP0114-20121206/1088_1 /TAXON_ID=31324 /ORGANISM="Goniomonas sp, Strain m" /LENGTH=306 /DNA_ID=CAMNT_0001725241 /DNA_START=62 /DNA_END=982 /DNA_ORIENTATION=+
MTGMLTVRPMTPEDIPIAAKICLDAFVAINSRIGLPSEFALDFEAEDIFTHALDTGNYDAFVAVDPSGEIVGSNIISVCDDVCGIGPITVKPDTQSSGVGRLLMQTVMAAAERRGKTTVRLLQIAANIGSYCLYVNMGFDPTGTVVHYEGRCTSPAPQGFSFKPITKDTLDACIQLHKTVCGYDRAVAIMDAAGQTVNPVGCVLDTQGQVVAYTTGLHLEGHTVAIGEAALRAIIVNISELVEAARMAGKPLAPPAIHAPHAYPGLCRWLSSCGFRGIRQLVQMGYGPLAASIIRPGEFYCPSISY